jgi:hypothetical protein
MKRISTTMALVLPLLWLTACAPATVTDPVQQPAGTTGPGPEVVTHLEDQQLERQRMAEMRQFMTMARQDLDRTERDIARVQEIAAQADPAVRAQWDQRIADMRREHTALRQQIRDAEALDHQAFAQRRADIDRRLGTLDVDVTRAHLTAIPDRTGFQTAAQARLDMLDRRMADWDRRMEMVDPQTRATHQARMTELRQERQRLGQHLAGIPDATDEDFQRMRTEFVDDLGTLDMRYQGYWTTFQDDTRDDFPFDSWDPDGTGVN